MKQCLINLLSNAIKFSETGGTITIEAAIDDEGREVCSASPTRASG